MSQAERDEEAAAVLEYEHMRAQGVSLAEIGAGRAKGIEKPMDEGSPARVEAIDEKGEAKYVEKV